MITSGAQVREEDWSAIASATAAAQLLIICFGGERDWLNVLKKLPPQLKQRLVEKPLEWPRLSEREGDLPGIIKEITTTLTDERGRVPVFSADAIKWLLERPGESTAQLYNRMKKAVTFARELNSDFIANDHLDAIEKKDKRAALRNDSSSAA
jgi:DNA-binding NtrC family response regulator